MRSESVLGPAASGTGAGAFDGATGWLRFPPFFGDFPRLRANVVPFFVKSPIEGVLRWSSTPPNARNFYGIAAPGTPPCPSNYWAVKLGSPWTFVTGGGTPFTGERLGLRAIEPHSQVKGSLRCGKPIGFLVLSRTLVLEIEVKRAIGVDLEWHPTSDCEAVQAVSDLKPLRVIESDGTRRRSRVARNSLTMAPQS